MIDLKKYKHIHCIGIGGIGLSAVAEILLSRGYEVSGSDMKESEMADKLRSHGIDVHVGHDAANIEGADLIVYSAAISMSNPELAKAKELGVPAITRAQALGALMQEYDNSIAISGTHGKTTTTAMVSLVLRDANLDPTILVGGNLSEIGGNVKVGTKEYFVTEACEYMDSFLSLKPKIEIILNIDSDHLDYFKDVDHIARSFDKFAGLVPEDGAIIAYDANPFVKSVIEGRPNAITFGLSETCDYFASDIEFSSEGMPSFTANHGGEKLCRISLSVPGEHNILNALSAFACAHILGVEPDAIAKTLEGYTGTQRRFDLLGKVKGGIKVIDDYAHHPTEIKATLAAVNKMKHGKLWCLFQPHTYTRTMALMDEFAGAFAEADEVVLAEIYAAREKNIHKITSSQLMEKILMQDPDKKISCIEDFDEMAKYVYENASEGDLILTMGAGDIYRVGEKILELDK